MGLTQAVPVDVNSAVPAGPEKARLSKNVSSEREAFARIARVIASPAVLWFDLLSLSMAVVLALLSFYVRQTVADPALFFAMRISMKNLFVCVACWMVWSILLWGAGLYQSYRVLSRGHMLFRIAAGVTGCSVVTFGAMMFRNMDHAFMRPLSIFWFGGALMMIAARFVVFGYESHVHPLFRPSRRALVVGTGARARLLATELPNNRTYHYDVAGFIDASPQEHEGEEVPVLGNLTGLEDILMREPIDEVFIALPIRSHYEQIAQVIALCEACGVRSQYQTDLFETSGIAKRRVFNREDGSRVVLEMVHSDHRLYVKRAIDVFGACFGLIVLSPVLIVVAILVRMSGEGPVIFTQTRFGLNKRRFGMHKFRSMVQNAEQLQAKLEHLNEAGGPVFKIKNDPRITPIGRFIRKTSLDEMPQLWNVLKGDMSLVGPRPLPMRDVGNFSELALMRRFSVKPGMTGLWQVSGRSNTKTFDGWIQRDLEYIDNWSLVMDIRILFKTIPAVLKGSGAS